MSLQKQQDAKSKLWGYIDSQTQEIVIPFMYDNAQDFLYKKDLAPVCKDGKWGIVNSQGVTVVDFIYDNASTTNFGWGSLGGIDKFASLNAMPITRGVVVENNGRKGFIDADSISEVVECKYNSLNCSHLSSGIIFSEVNGKYGIVDIKGNEITKNKFTKKEAMSLVVKRYLDNYGTNEAYSMTIEEIQDFLNVKHCMLQYQIENVTIKNYEDIKNNCKTFNNICKGALNTKSSQEDVSQKDIRKLEHLYKMLIGELQFSLEEKHNELNAELNV